MLFLVTLSLHFRATFGPWPENVDHIPPGLLSVHYGVCVFFAVFRFLAVPLWVLLLICCRTLCLTLRERMLQPLIYAVGWVLTAAIFAFFGADWRTWFLH